MKPCHKQQLHLLQQILLSGLVPGVTEETFHICVLLGLFSPSPSKGPHWPKSLLLLKEDLKVGLVLKLRRLLVSPYIQKTAQLVLHLCDEEAEEPNYYSAATRSVSTIQRASPALDGKMGDVLQCGRSSLPISYRTDARALYCHCFFFHSFLLRLHILLLHSKSAGHPGVKENKAERGAGAQETRDRGALTSI